MATGMAHKLQQYFQDWLGRPASAGPDRPVRTARLLARAQAVLGSRETALKWMRRPKRRFQGKSPVEMISTEPGGRLVAEMLIQIDQGIFL